MSYGTFGGRIVAVEKFISDNGKFRVLIALTLMRSLAIVKLDLEHKQLHCCTCLV
jgi:hypothetical protein